MLTMQPCLYVPPCIAGMQQDHLQLLHAKRLCVIRGCMPCNLWSTMSPCSLSALLGSLIVHGCNSDHVCDALFG
jgi:hypothetical protein